MYHEIFVFDEIETATLDRYSENMIFFIACQCAACYYLNGFQVVYGVHKGEHQKYHIHFAVNAVNFKTGQKFHTNLNADQRAREKYMNDAVKALIMKYGGSHYE